MAGLTFPPHPQAPGWQRQAALSKAGAAGWVCSEQGLHLCCAVTQLITSKPDFLPYPPQIKFKVLSVSSANLSAKVSLRKAHPARPSAVQTTP